MTEETDMVKPWLPPGFIPDNMGLRVSETVTEADFAAGCQIVSRLANVMHESLFWWLGDLINAGERMFPNKYEQWLEFTDKRLSFLR